MHIFRIAACLCMLFAGVVALHAQPTDGDCLGAIPVCNWNYDVPVIQPGEGNILNEINGLLSCLASGEENGTWYTFTVQTNGMLNFNIIPYDPTDDYDWALYNLTNANCSEISSNASLEVACNYSGQTLNGGITGANGGNSPQDEPEVPVTAGQTYVLYVSNYDQIDAGYKLDFSNSSAQIPDNVPPVLLSATPNAICGATQISIRFSENIKCNTISGSDFSLTGPGGPYTITNVISAECNMGASYSDEYILVVNPPMMGAGVFNLNVVGTIADVCGNNLDVNNQPPININYNALSLTATVIDANCGVDDGQATVHVNGGTSPYIYLWNDPNSQNGPVATGLARGWYKVQVTDANNCVSTLDVYVGDPTSFTYTIAMTPDTCSKGAGQVRVIVTGTTAPYNYTWNGWDMSTTTPSNTMTGLTGDSTYNIRITDILGCWLDTNLVIGNVVNDSMQAFFTANPPKVDYLYPFTQVINQSTYETSILWLLPDGSTSTQQSLQIELPGIGLHPVSLVAIDKNGCRDTFTTDLEVTYQLSVFIPNSFTPNEDMLNDTFKIVGIGIDTSSFEMRIYDRWGQMVYYSKNFDYGWDGRINGQTLPDSEQGAFTYHIFLRELNGTPHNFLGKLIVLK